MRVGEFKIDDSAPKLHDTRAIAMLSPWVDVGRVGALALDKLEQHLDALELGRMARPGKFIDFTRLRPTMRFVEGRRVLSVPNSVVKYARDAATERDYIFLHLQEPHAMAEDYTDAILALLKHCGVIEYCRIGSMYDYVPHSRPLKVTGSLSAAHMERAKGLVAVRKSKYEGPTSIVNLVGEALADMDVESTSLMVHIPHYAMMDEDHAGASRLLEVLCAIYGFPPSLAESERGRQQYAQVSQAVERNPEAKSLVERLEADFDREVEAEPDEPVTMSPSLEKFLQEMSKRLEDSTTTE